MKANLVCDEQGVLKIKLSAEHEFEVLLMESLEGNDKYTKSVSIIQDYDGFGLKKPLIIDVEFILKKQ